MAVMSAPVMPAPPPPLPLTSIPASSPTLSAEITPAVISGNTMSNQPIIWPGLSSVAFSEKLVT